MRESEMRTPGRMYEGVRTWNPFVGCYHNCIYCKPSFQRQAKRRRKWCEKCYNFEPHFHPERLNRIPKAKTIFACAYGDVAFASFMQLKHIFFRMANSDKTFYLQSKNPEIFNECLEKLPFGIPENVVLGTTIETDIVAGPVNYWRISKAPFCYKRYQALAKLDWPRKYVTIEPILEFNKAILVRWIKKIQPEFVYIGYDNHGCKLPEPPLSKTQELIEDLEKITEVRLKTIRKAWWEVDA